jgi:microcystin-dependent protein
MATTTPLLGFSLPTVGADRDTWGAELNANWSSADKLISQAMPIGVIADFAGSAAPSGWLICDGRLLSRTTYSSLFAVLGTQWGAGDGSTTFGLPAVNGRALIGPGAGTDAQGASYSYAFAQLLGSVAAPISQSNLPNYAMATDAQGVHSHGGATAAGGSHTHGMDSQGSHSHSGLTGYENASHVHTGTVDSAGSHYHTVNVTNTGGGTVSFSYGGVVASGYTDTAGAHTHTFTTGGQNPYHQHAISVDGAHVHNITYSGNLTLPINPDGSHTHTVMLGGGGVALPILTPVLVVTKIIYAGSQAATLMALATSAPSALGAEAEMADIRAELAQLRALIGGRIQRTISAPMRGSH